jgi:DNA polymerase-3 subunit gamma/tau
MLGLADRARVVDLFAHLMSGDVAAALAEFRAQYDSGADPVAILTDLAEFNHLVTRLRFVPSAADDNSLTGDERERGRQFAESLSVRVLSRTWQMLLKGLTEVQGSNRPVMAAEMVLIRLAHAADLPTLDEALKQLPEGGAGSPGIPRPQATPAAPAPAPTAQAVSRTAMPSGGGGAQTMRLVEAEPQAPAIQPPVEIRQEAPSVRVASLADIANLADQHRDLAFKVMLKRCVRPVSIEPGRLAVALTEDAPKTLLGDLTQRLSDWTGRRWLVSVSRETGGRTLAEEESEKRETAFLDARSDPAVAAILARFPGARIIDVRLPETGEGAAADDDAIAEEPLEDDE